MFAKSSKAREVLTHPFTFKQRARHAQTKAILAEQQASPTLDFGGVTIVNPVYRGATPYRGPEVSDSRTRGPGAVVPVRGENVARARAERNACIATANNSQINATKSSKTKSSKKGQESSQVVAKKSRPPLTGANISLLALQMIS